MTKFKLSTLFLSLSLIGFAALQSEAQPDNATFAAARTDTSSQAKHEARKAKHEARKAERLKQFDLNGDGVLSETEKIAAKKAHFKKLDLNNDGNVTMAEAKAAKEKMRAERHAGDALSHDGKKHKRGDKRKGRSGKHFERADTNGDGVMSWEEFSAKRERKGKGKRDGSCHGRG